MIGLVVIVLLITIAFLFLVQFGLNDRSDKHSFERIKLAESTLPAIFATTVQSCQSETESVDLSVSNLLQDCAENRDGGFAYACGDDGKDSCAYLQEELLPVLLKGSLEVFKKKYELKSFLLRDPDHPLLFLKGNGGCKKSKNIDTSGFVPLNTGNAGLINSVLLVCD